MNAMFNCQTALNVFYQQDVRLGPRRRARLKESRKACLGHVKEGLRRLGHPVYERVCIQGSYVMHTLNQHPNGEFDIDVAVIFKKEDLPKSPLRARQRVAAAMRASGVRFATMPLARLNAVTAWYSDHHHVDLAVYRESTNFWGEPVLEHASSEWTARNPVEVTRWFKKEDKRLSPKLDAGAAVEPGQFRRVVRLIKMFARSRLYWDLPGGLIISTLVAEVYESAPERDDIALYNTLVRLQKRLHGSCDVKSPVDSTSLTHRKKNERQVRALLARLEEILPRLAILFEPLCMEPQAFRAWWFVFRHEFWLERARAAELAALKQPQNLRIQVGLGDSSSGPFTLYYPSHGPIPRGAHVRFALRKRLGLEPPFTCHWKIQYRGSEAQAASDLAYATVGPEPFFLQEAKYAGRHTVSFELIKDGRVVARGTRNLLVAAP
jgi:hypothetical protein